MRSTTRVLAFFAVLAFAWGIAPRASAKLDNATWKEAKKDFKALFSAPGKVEDKRSLVALLVQDRHSRSWKLLSEALIRECQQWWSVNEKLADTSGEHARMLLKTSKPSEQKEKDLEAKEREVREHEKRLVEERQALRAVVDAVLQGPEALRNSILKRASAGVSWPYRAAAVRLAAATIEEDESRRLLEKALANDKDRRVRGAAVDALIDVEAGWEDLVIGRLGDSAETVQLQALRVIEKRELRAAVSQLIDALAVCAPRMQVEVSRVLRTLTGESFDHNHDLWLEWWADNKKQFEGDQKIAKGGQQRPGKAAASERIVFIIDISASMKFRTRKDRPRDGSWGVPPAGPAGGGVPPPPPPPEISSGAKIDIAKHELKKAIKKLPKGTTFNIIAFNQLAKQWKPEMQQATERLKKDAYMWIRSLRPAGHAYIDGALRLAFQLAQVDQGGKGPAGLPVDTIVLLSGGLLTDNAFNAKRMAPEIVLDHVDGWNKGKAIVIHCVGVDAGGGVEFLRELAARSGGTFIRR